MQLSDTGHIRSHLWASSIITGRVRERPDSSTIGGWRKKNMILETCELRGCRIKGQGHQISCIIPQCDSPSLSGVSVDVIVPQQKFHYPAVAYHSILNSVQFQAGVRYAVGYGIHSFCVQERALFYPRPLL